MSLTKKQVFRDAPRLELSSTIAYVFPDPQFVEIKLEDSEAGWVVIDSYDVENARALRDWLTSVLPDEPSMRYCGYHPDRQLECAYCTGYRDPLHEPDGRTSGEPEKQA